MIAPVLHMCKGEGVFYSHQERLCFVKGTKTRNREKAAPAFAKNDQETHPHWYLVSCFMGCFILPKERIHACFRGRKGKK